MQPEAARLALPRQGVLLPRQRVVSWSGDCASSRTQRLWGFGRANWVLSTLFANNHHKGGAFVYQFFLFPFTSAVNVQVGGYGAYNGAPEIRNCCHFWALLLFITSLVDFRGVA